MKPTGFEDCVVRATVCVDAPVRAPFINQKRKDGVTGFTSDPGRSSR